MRLPVIDPEQFPLGWELLTDYVQGEDKVWRADKTILSRDDLVLFHRDQWWVARAAPKEDA